VPFRNTTTRCPESLRTRPCSFTYYPPTPVPPPPPVYSPTPCVESSKSKPPKPVFSSTPCPESSMTKPPPVFTYHLPHPVSPVKNTTTPCPESSKTKPLVYSSTPCTESSKTKPPKPPVSTYYPPPPPPPVCFDTETLVFTCISSFSILTYFLAPSGKHYHAVPGVVPDEAS
jgi:hypothetical protein